MPNEFELIKHFFSAKKQRPDVLLGIGDDCALVTAPMDVPGARNIYQALNIAMSMDTLIAGVHFPVNTNPADIGYKSLAVNLSDLAAMGAEPAWVMLALTLPNADQQWLSEFQRGFFELIDHYNLQLIGGDTTRGALSITVHVSGFVPENKALRRSGAKVGDKIYVTGTLGDAGFALQTSSANSRLNRPTPRIGAGIALRNIATSCIDISDGLAADLQHILNASQVGAIIYVDDLPLSSTLKQLPKHNAWQLALSAGDDYELCFTVPEQQEKQLANTLKNNDCSYTCIGSIEEQKDLRIIQRDGTLFLLQNTGFQHF
jgi:thiamine-monophosphate kinase